MGGDRKIALHDEHSTAPPALQISLKIEDRGASCGILGCMVFVSHVSKKSGKISTRARLRISGVFVEA